VSDRLTQTLLRQIAVSCDVIITEARTYEPKAECDAHRDEGQADLEDGARGPLQGGGCTRGDGGV
jgi:hypothetical protein